ncbi:cytochrome P450 [Novosphingobium sp. 9U]|uniref:cytochrome P450 n=1 Tax=Novosphingobium sp. 9U TaxID=2653158 RepID=UPI0012F32743|nr:cytochrome P450 [Novosphingobium sp. 9U]VWX53390.1 Cytochrome P450 [Novosphingobium sp. 9U]
MAHDASYPDFYSDPHVIDTPREYFAQMRAINPVVREAYHGSMIVSGYDEVSEVLTSRDGTFSSSVSVLGPLPPLPFEPEGDDIREQLDAHRDLMPWTAHLVCFDGDKHTKHRALLTSLLTFKRLKANEAYLGELVDKLIDEFQRSGTCEVVQQFAHKVSTYAISDIMGISMEDRFELLELLGAPPSQIDGDAVHKVGPDPLIFLKERFDGYILARQAEPCGDLLSDLANARFKDGSAPSYERLAELARFLFGAGQDTTSRLMAMAIRVLGDDLALQDRLRREPERIGDFLEEVLRIDPPVKVVYRVVQKSTQIAGVPAPAGTVVNVSLTGANNDPRHYADPDRFDLDRQGVRDHMAFSRGAHGCLGAPLARLEAKVAIERLLARTSQIRISEAHHGAPGERRYAFEPTYSFRNIQELHIEFEPAVELA